MITRICHVTVLTVVALVAISRADNRQNNGADFRIFRGVNQTFYIDTVQVSLAQP